MYEREKKQKEAELMAMKEEQHLKRRREEEEEVRRMRRDAVHKANPVKAFKPVTIKGSDKPLTAPQTPAFSKRLNK